MYAEEKKNAYRVWCGKMAEKRPLGRLRSKEDNNGKMHLVEMQQKGVK